MDVSDTTTTTGRDTGDAADRSSAAAELRAALSSVASAVGAAELVCEHVQALDRGFLPSVYVERDGLLRCVAQRGYWQVLDGIPVQSGVMGRAFRTGEDQVVEVGADPDFLAAVPGLVTEVSLPLWVGERVVGVFNLEATRRLSDDELRAVGDVATSLEAHLDQIGVRMPESALHRLARSRKELAALTDARHVEAAVVRLACDISLFSSSMLVSFGDHGVASICGVQGPLGAVLRELDQDSLHDLHVEFGRVSSFVTTGRQGLATPLLRRLRDAGASSVAVFPIVTDHAGEGLLILADFAPVRLGADEREAMELLTAEAARTFDQLAMMSDLRNRATLDPLTGLGNHGAFHEALLSLVGQSRTRWGVVIGDVDGLKRVNDTRGHQVGDEMLVKAAGSLAEALRFEDRVYRVGGDEFAAIINDIDADSAPEVGVRLCEAARGVLADYGAGLSIGIALPQPFEPANELLRRADEALYRVKRMAPGTALVAPAPDRREEIVDLGAGDPAPAAPAADPAPDESGRTVSTAFRPPTSPPGSGVRLPRAGRPGVRGAPPPASEGFGRARPGYARPDRPGRPWPPGGDER